MTRPAKIFSISLLTVLLLSGGGGLYLSRCLLAGEEVSIGGPGAAHAADVKYTCGMHPMIIVDEPGLCPICAMDLTPLKSGTGGDGEKSKGERKIKYWVAPMDPTYIRDEAGKSPMGMDLVPVYEDEAATGAVIRIDPVTAQNMGVRTAVAVRTDLSRTVRTVGLVGYEEPRQYSVNSKVAGWVEKLHVAETGEMVRKGQALLEIYSPELVSAQEELLLALANNAALSQSPFPEIADGGKRLLESSRRRLKLWDVSSRQIRDLEQTRQVKKTLTLYAPYGGIVTMKMVNEGMYVQSGMELFQLSDISKVWVFADIYEYELPWVKAGQKATVELPFVGGSTLTGTVSTVYPYVEAKTRTVKARIDLDNPGLELKPDMYVNVRLEGETVQGALAVPGEAVLSSGEQSTVFVALGEGKFEPRRVKTGLQGEGGMIEIRQGLLDGEKVVTSAQFMLDSESKLREAIQKMLEPAGEPEPAGPEEEIDDLFGEEKEDLDELF
ncbi:MAG: efflux RND transporter periplasmic adaptor subunit [Desulfuromonas sp.]|uniref:efflux RND transporter periplasmic adaptor subunit n=1 Tax=Desulfuromonas sp. TaxID=892 RepID=UPI000CA739E3|nr:efflux RND transporter periplasmic adaptor subunit [Desulfuromonas sp.]PLX86144.1 MAG: efflux RND transporter periplasmic adaptor subunit [Desulfuromonas sp.]